MQKSNSKPELDERNPCHFAILLRNQRSENCFYIMFGTYTVWKTDKGNILT